MAQILVRGLEGELVAALKDRARENDRSLEGEVRAILKSVVDRDRRHKWAVAEIEKLQAEFAGRTTGDSADLLHEGRAEWDEKWGSS